MHLVEILLPVSDNDGHPFPGKLYADLREELTQRFGGVTVFSRSPAKGMFRDEGKVVHDDVVIYEVMAEALDTEWWRECRLLLERLFAQDEIVIRATTMSRL